MDNIIRPRTHTFHQSAGKILSNFGHKFFSYEQKQRGKSFRPTLYIRAVVMPYQSPTIVSIGICLDDIGFSVSFMLQLPCGIHFFGYGSKL